MVGLAARITSEDAPRVSADSMTSRPFVEFLKSSALPRERLFEARSDVKIQRGQVYLNDIGRHLQEFRRQEVLARGLASLEAPAVGLDVAGSGDVLDGQLEVAPGGCRPLVTLTPSGNTGPNRVLFSKTSGQTHY